MNTSSLNLRLLCESSQENIKLLSRYGGHESLWYQRRLWSTVVLQIILLHSRPGETLAVNLHHLTLPTVLLEAQEIEGEHNDQEFNLDHQFLSNKIMFESFSLSECISEWIVRWIQYEIDFVTCLILDNSWERSKQKTMGMKYLFHLFCMV